MNPSFGLSTAPTVTLDREDGSQASPFGQTTPGLEMAMTVLLARASMMLAGLGK
jgi:hypothetical protein